MKHLTRFEGVTDWYQSQGYRELAVMSSASSAVTFTSVYTDSEPDKAFWRADDEEIPAAVSTTVIVIRIHGLPDTAQMRHEFSGGGAAINHPVEFQPTTESPGYVTESDPEEDPKEYEDDETEDGPVDYPMDEGDDGDDDDGDPSRDDANDEDEDDKNDEEEHLAPADSAIVVPVDEPARPQTSISLPPEAEVERLLAMTTPSPSPPISLSPPSAGERLARCMAPPAHSSPLLPSSGCPTQIQTLRITSTQALIDVVAAALPSPLLPPLRPSLYIPPPVDHRDDIPESEQPPRKRLCLSTLGSRYEVGESSTARPTRGQGIDYGFVSTVDVEERRQGIRDVGSRLAELHEHDTQDLYALLEDAQDSRITFSRHRTRHSSSMPVYFHSGTQHQVHESCFQMQQAELAVLRETDRRCQAQMVETLRVIRDMRREMSDMQAELLSLREQQRRARQPTQEAGIPDAHRILPGEADSHR
ncbi:hypothetical protein Tco_1081166 [Tanacetum coccineum]|uniref:Uncharacterized protein n=1 Tax=Tanacetum coccineum TaxID=301880 RepID=A0ABQ5HXY4_9ASTR